MANNPVPIHSSSGGNDDNSLHSDAQPQMLTSIRALTKTELDELADCATWHSLVEESRALKLLNLHYNLSDIPIEEMKRLMDEYGPENDQPPFNERKEETATSIKRTFRRWFPLFFHWFYYSYKAKCWVPRVGVHDEKKRRELLRLQAKQSHAHRISRKYCGWRDQLIISTHVTTKYRHTLEMARRLAAAPHVKPSLPQQETGTHTS